MTDAVLDFLAVGCGPFNLGLAALADPVEGLEGLVLDAGDEFAWHPGMLLEASTLQTPFLSDLASLADPTSPWTFLNYLKTHGRLYPFYIRESFYPLRAEYDAYCRWVAESLPAVRFGHRVDRVDHDPASGLWTVAATRTTDGAPTTFSARRLVLGIGTEPFVPGCLHDHDGGLLGGADAGIVHSEHYLARRADLRRRRRIVLLGSGQSAAEIYSDLLADIDTAGYELVWATRSARFFPLELSKLTLEMTSPDYTDHFFALPEKTRDQLLGSHAGLYKGINDSTLEEIYEQLYRKSFHGPVPTRLLTHAELVDAAWDPAGSDPGSPGEYVLDLHHTEQDRGFTLRADAVVLATGYRERPQDLLRPLGDRIARDHAGRLAVNRDYTVDVEGAGPDQQLFVQNAEAHTHGFVAPDLGLAAHRNSWLIAAMTGREVYPIERRIAFQEFDAPAPTDSTGPTPEGATT